MLEIDALREGERFLPPLLDGLAAYERLAWTAFHHGGQRRLSGWGWNQEDPLPEIPWTVEESVEVLVDLPQAVDDAFQFNRWPNLVA